MIMIKKILLLITFFFFVAFASINYVNASCSYNWWNIAWSIDSCLKNTELVDASGDTTIEWWFKDKFIDWTKTLAWFLWLIAVWAIVLWGFMMAISWWEEEKIKKAKDMVKWAIIWFFWIMVAWSLIAIIVKFIYSL